MSKKLKKALRDKINTLNDTEFVSLEDKIGHNRVYYTYKGVSNFVTISGTPNNGDEKIAAKIVFRDIRRKNKGIY